ncbi:hypothetical protein G7046_g4848 [Stylonectria norvegica]|nr:hypothetical protein G7046_g4848 [Stylonectria norvegica]
MGLPSFLRTMYDVDTLDTRFTTTSNTPYRAVIDARDDPEPRRESFSKEKRGQGPKWKTPEFYLYYAVFSVAVPYMFWIVFKVSSPSDPRYQKYERRLSPGWIPGRKIDISDSQYHVFRENIPYMAALLLFHPLLRKLWNIVYPTPGKRSEGGANRMEQRASFDFWFGLIFLVFLHGFSAFKILIILALNYHLATKLPRKYIPAATWFFNISILFANELCQGYRFRNIASYISPPFMAVIENGVRSVDSPLMKLGGWMDGYRGLLARWEVLFNLTVLRLISFNMDRYWSVDGRNSNSIEKKQLDPANLSERNRVTIPADVKDFSFRNYIAYTIYAPLYLAGPILTFNDFISQLKYRAASIEKPRTIRYGIRFLLALLAMEVVLHINYVNAISKSRPVWSEYTAAQISLLSFTNLHILWMKLLLPWRLFRLWALIDGIDPPENMVRCVSNSPSTVNFWRGWHRSYNRWMVRYIYIPLGGASFRNWRTTVRSIVTYLLCFTFVALWHDIQLRLLIWGWLVVLFMVPEWTGVYFFPAKAWENRPTQFRMMCAAGGVLNCLMMVSANVVGFALGMDGLISMLHSIVRDWSGIIFIVTASVCIFTAVQVMFEIRESEKRKGVTLRC